MTSSHRPRKRFGQHFLNDGFVVQQIVTAISPQRDQHLVEIGPGLGVLTEVLLPNVKQLDVVELDRDLIPKLNKHCLPLGNLIIHSADALKFNFCELQTSTEKLRIVGNLPYNISTPLMFHLLRQSVCIADMHFMLQKEVVERIAANPGTKDYGRLSVMMQYRCQVTKLFDVAASSFSPPPKVVSAVIRLQPYGEPPVQVGKVEDLEKIVAASFGQRRKTLRNNLKKILPEGVIKEQGIDPGCRAETLSIDEFAKLANAYTQLQ